MRYIIQGRPIPYCACKPGPWKRWEPGMSYATEAEANAALAPIAAEYGGHEFQIYPFIGG